MLRHRHRLADRPQAPQGGRPETAARGPGQAAKDRDAALAAKGADWAFARFMPTAAEVARARRAGKKVLLVGAPVAAAPPASMPS